MKRETAEKARRLLNEIDSIEIVLDCCNYTPKQGRDLKIQLAGYKQELEQLKDE